LKLVLSPRAALDLEQIGDYIAQDNPSRAASFVRELQQVCRRIAKFPAAFPARDDLAPGIRMAIHGNYLILFSSPGKDVRVERILHGTRNLSNPEFLSE
jgi:toxin ParE1/3/4